MKLRTGPQQKPAPKDKAAGGTPEKYFGNSRTPVHPNLDRHSSRGAKKERD